MRRKRVLSALSLLTMIALLGACATAPTVAPPRPDARRILAAGHGAAQSQACVAPYTPAPVLMLAPVRLNGDGRPLSFLVDTGSPTMVDVSVADELRLPAGNRTALHDAAGENEIMHTARIETLAVGQAQVDDLIVAVADLNKGAEKRRPKFDGILGHTFLRHFTITVDPKAKTIAFWPAGPAADEAVAREAAAPGAISLPLQTSETPSILTLPIRANQEKRTFVAIVDTGSSLPLAAPQMVADVWRLPTGPGNSYEIDGIAAVTAFGERVTGAHGYRVDHLFLGDADCGLCPLVAGKFATPSLGMRFLAQYRFTIDYAGKRLVLVKIRSYRRHTTNATYSLSSPVRCSAR
jgi:hypothetical protein